MELEIALLDSFELKPKIIVMGVGGAGVNAVNNMVDGNVEGVEFWGANTDAQALKKSVAPNKMQLGVNLTKGLGAGSNPGVGRAAAEESLEQVRSMLEGCNMLFITAGMGGGTGTGAAPVIARIAKDMGILTVGVVTKPFHFEGGKRMKAAELGLKELEENVDTLIVIPNQNLFRVANETTTFAEAFKKADEVLRSGVTSITDLIVIPGLINLDFADISTVMGEMGQAVMGTGEADGKERSIKASEAAISNPILDNTSMKGAKGVLVNVTGGSDMTLFEIEEAVSRIKDKVDNIDANIIFGSTLNEDLAGKIRVSVVATGICGIAVQDAALEREGVSIAEYGGAVINGGKDRAVGRVQDIGTVLVSGAGAQVMQNSARDVRFVQSALTRNVGRISGQMNAESSVVVESDGGSVSGAKVAGQYNGENMREAGKKAYQHEVYAVNSTKFANKSELMESSGDHEHTAYRSCEKGAALPLKQKEVQKSVLLLDDSSADVGSDSTNSGGFNSNNFLKQKGFFIPPKALEPECDSIEDVRLGGSINDEVKKGDDQVRVGGDGVMHLMSAQRRSNYRARSDDSGEVGGRHHGSEVGDDNGTLRQRSEAGDTEQVDIRYNGSRKNGEGSKGIFSRVFEAFSGTRGDTGDAYGVAGASQSGELSGQPSVFRRKKL